MSECAKTDKEPTYIFINRSIHGFESAIVRFEDLLDEYTLNANSLKKTAEDCDKEQEGVASTWTFASSKIEENTKRLHELIDRLDNIFK